MMRRLAALLALLLLGAQAGAPEAAGPLRPDPQVMQAGPGAARGALIWLHPSHRDGPPPWSQRLTRDGWDLWHLDSTGPADPITLRASRLKPAIPRFAAVAGPAPPARAETNASSMSPGATASALLCVLQISARCVLPLPLGPHTAQTRAGQSGQESTSANAASLLSPGTKSARTSPRTPGTAGVYSRTSPGRWGGSHCHPSQTSVKPWRIRKPSPNSFSALGFRLVLARLKNPSIPLPPRFDTSYSTAPLPRSGFFGRHRAARSRLRTHESSCRSTDGVSQKPKYSRHPYR